LRKNNVISYEYLLKNFLQVVNKDSYFMNYGRWEKNTLTLQEASINLCDTMYDLAIAKNTNLSKILDVGCGYGSQDFYW
jgi:cyclopropane fatty-acyl-phospholipid synthase-like methyltransferase